MLQMRTHRLVIQHRKTLSHHASTVLSLKDGRVLVAWFGGSREHNDDVGIYLAELEKGHFSEPRLMASAMEPHWNPVLFQCRDQRIQLYYKKGHEIPDWRTWIRESRDLGRTWSEPRELVPGDDSGGRGPVKNKPLRLKNGDMIAPASTERGCWRCFMDLSGDDGRTWKRSGMILPAGTESASSGHGIIQPTLWEDGKGIHALMRSSEGRIFRSDSRDGGRTWCGAYPTALPNNNSGIDLTRLENGILVLVHNPVGDNFGPRTPLSVSVSRDDGDTWTHICDLESEEGEFSYPAIVSRGNRIWLTYTYKRENIAYWEFEWTD